MVALMKNVVKRYKGHTALDGLNLTLARGEVLGLLGPNGAGKTTAIRVLTGLTKATAGETRLFGETVISKAVRRRMGVVPQDLALYETLSARDNLTYFGRLYGLKGLELRTRVDEVLAVLGLSDVGGKAPKKFSGGMKRRLNIGCAVIHKPELLILDEPTVGIDPQSRNHILDYVSAVNKQGTTVIYTSHYMEEVERVCTRIVVMDVGKAIAGGTVESLTQAVVADETVTVEVYDMPPVLIDAINALDGVLSCHAVNRKLTVTGVPGSGIIQKVLGLAMPYGIVGVTAKRPTLEDAFLSLTGKKLRDGGEGA